jgi:peptide/nickel transport system permease protein
MVAKFRPWSSPSVAAAFSILIFFVILSISAQYLTREKPNNIDLSVTLQPPSILDGKWSHPLGTDALGRDVMSQLVYGSRISLGVGVAAAAVAGSIGTIAGVISGFRGGLIDHVLARIMDIQLAFPTIILAIAAVAFLRPGVWSLIIVLGVSGWVTYARVARAETFGAQAREFVEAAYAQGAGTTHIVFRHIFPNILSPLVVIASFSMASTIVAEASLSFLGLGLPPEVPSWGHMLAEGRENMEDAWWLATSPGVALVLLVMSINVIGDWLRDWLDPRSQQ